MSLRIIIRGPDKTEAILTHRQFNTVSRIITKMMNNGITRLRAEKMIAAKLLEAGDPLVFEPAQSKEK